MDNIIEEAVLVNHIGELVEIVDTSEEANASLGNLNVQVLNFISWINAKTLLIELECSQVIEPLLKALHEATRLVESGHNHVNVILSLVDRAVPIDGGILVCSGLVLLLILAETERFREGDLNKQWQGEEKRN